MNKIFKWILICILSICFISCDGNVNSKLFDKEEPVVDTPTYETHTVTVTTPLDFTNDTVFDYINGDIGITWDKSTNTLTLENAKLHIEIPSEFCIKLPSDSTIIVRGNSDIIGTYDYAADTTSDSVNVGIKGIYSFGSLTIKGSDKLKDSLTIQSGNYTGSRAKDCYGIFASYNDTDSTLTCNLSISDIQLNVIAGSTNENTKTTLNNCLAYHGCRSIGIYSLGSIDITNSEVNAQSFGAETNADETQNDKISVGYGIYRNRKLTIKTSTVTCDRAYTTTTNYKGLYFNGIYGLTSRLDSTDYLDYGATEIDNSDVTTYSWASTSHPDTASQSSNNNPHDFAFSGANSLIIKNHSTLNCNTTNGKSMVLTLNTTFYNNGIVPLNICDDSKILSNGNVLVSYNGKLVDKGIDELFTITDGVKDSDRFNWQYEYGSNSLTNNSINTVAYTFHLKCIITSSTSTPMTISKL